MGFLERAFRKIKYIVGGSSFTETVFQKENEPSLDYRKATFETQEKTRATLDEIRLAEEADTARAKARAEQVRLKQQALRDEEVSQNPPLTQIELLPGQTEDVIKKSKLLNGKQLENYVNHLAQKNKK